MTRRSRILPTIILAATVVTASGCQWMAPRGAAARDHTDSDTPSTEAPPTVAETASAHERELVERTIELENEREANRLLRAELEATLVDLKYLESQFITLERQLTQEESRASAVSALADVQLMYDRMRVTRPRVLEPSEIDEVERRMAAADQSMTLGNYTAAVYYASRAMRLLDRSERRRKSFLSGGTARVVIVGAANVRTGPGQDFSVVGRLLEGDVVVEVDRSKGWKKVRLRSGHEGWIYATLVR